MKPKTRKLLFERYKEVGSKILFNQFVGGIAAGWVHLSIDGFGDSWFDPKWNLLDAITRLTSRPMVGDK